MLFDDGSASERGNNHHQDNYKHDGRYQNNDLVVRATFLCILLLYMRKQSHFSAVFVMKAFHKKDT